MSQRPHMMSSKYAPVHSGAVSGQNSSQHAQYERIRQSLEPYRKNGARNRILLGLLSNLPNEVDYALVMLTKVTYFLGDFHLGEIPFLLDALLDLCDPWLRLFEFHQGVLFTIGVYRHDHLISKSSEKSNLPQATLDRVIQVFLILQNALMHESSVSHATRYGKFMELLLKGMMSEIPQIRRYAAELLDSISTRYAFRPGVKLDTESVWMSCNFAILTQDQAAIKTGLRVLNRIFSIDLNEKLLFDTNTVANDSTVDVDMERNNNGLLGVVPQVVRRVAQLLLVPDEYINYEALEYFYHLTKINKTITGTVLNLLQATETSTLEGALGFNLIPRLLQLMEGSRSRSDLHVETMNTTQTHALGNKKAKRSKSSLALPRDSDRCTSWLRNNYGATSDLSNLLNVAAFVRQNDIYEEYVQSISTDSEGSVKAEPCSSSEFVIALAGAFPDARINYIKEESSNGQQMIPIIIGIFKKNTAPEMDSKNTSVADLQRQSSETDMNTSRTSLRNIVPNETRASFVCKWCSENGEICDVAKSSASELLEHVQQEHAGSDDTLQCRWTGCEKIINGATIFANVANHIMAHGSSVMEFADIQRLSAETLVQERSNGASREPIGTTLTAALILRNIARHDVRHLLPYESRIASIAYSSHESAKSAAIVLNELAI